MHRIATTPGGWTPDSDGVVLIEQTPAPIVFLTAADTEIQTLAGALPQLPEGFPAVHAVNLLHLQQQLTIDVYVESVLAKAHVIVLRLLGGKAYWNYGLEVVQETVEQSGALLIVVPGDDRPDVALMQHSTVPLSMVDQVWRYLVEGGVENMVSALQFVAELGLEKSYSPLPPVPVPRLGRYPWRSMEHDAPRVGLLFYRAHYLAGNTQPIDALCSALADRGLAPVPVFISSLRDTELQADMMALFAPKGEPAIQVLLNATSFSLARLDADAPDVALWERLDVPVIQVILSGGTEAQWRSLSRGLSPRDTAMNVVLPEVDGRIIGRAVSFKAVQERHPVLETEVVTYQAVGDRVEFVADLAANWVRLRQTPIQQRRVALILANYPTRDGRLANGVGLDTPASCVEILKAMQTAGYPISPLPKNGDELIRWLTQGITNDLEQAEMRVVHQTLSVADYRAFFATLPESVQRGMGDRWGAPPDQDIPIAGIQLGNVFVGIQPSRGYDRDPSLNYHAPDLEPTHAYLAFYHWLRHRFGAQAMVHVGKHGNLEWLPGKGVALSDECYPEVAFGAMPHLYPFIVNDPGEGAQAKRRSQAVILDHLTPPMTRAELYGTLHQLEGVIDEYYDAQTLNPSRLPALREKIAAIVQQEHLQTDLGLDADPSATFEDSVLNSIDGYLCELKEAQIRDGLHIFGQCPQGRQLRDLVVAIARSPGTGRAGLMRAIAQDDGHSLDPLTADLAAPFSDDYRTVGDWVDHLEAIAAGWVEQVMAGIDVSVLTPPAGAATQQELRWIGDRLLPALRQTSQELSNLLRGLDGCYIPSGASGAPTRGRPDVLPTGRNFYSVDIRAVPTQSAWEVGRRAADAVIERYTQENGDYPKTLALSMWGTATMRTGGDDMAEALALLGVRPVWDGSSRRVIDFEILPLSVLGRPRVDVTLRISGFFRDAFANLIDLFQRAVEAIAALDEPADQNPLAAQVQLESQHWQSAGLTAAQAEERSRYRVFGSKPGAYGAGLQGLIDAQNWSTDADLARAYINWSSYAYSGSGEGKSATDAFEQRLKSLQIVLHNQDNREHDLLDSDDYYQFQGGLTAAVRTIAGTQPTTYFGDHSRPENPRVRALKDEIARVYRSRVINPKWIAGVMRHGYKGAFEMAATVDYLFAYDATARCVEDHMYQGVADAYLFDPAVHAFIQQKNPWALRDMAERLLEANQRGLWQDANPDSLEQLRAIALQAEGAIESASDGSNV